MYYCSKCHKYTNKYHEYTNEYHLPVCVDCIGLAEVKAYQKVAFRTRYLMKRRSQQQQIPQYQTKNHLMLEPPASIDMMLEIAEQLNHRR